MDKAITVEGDAVGLVKDTLAILASREIKLTSMRKNLVEELADDRDMVGDAVASAQTKIISQVCVCLYMEGSYLHLTCMYTHTCTRKVVEAYVSYCTLTCPRYIPSHVHTITYIACTWVSVHYAHTTIH